MCGREIILESKCETFFKKWVKRKEEGKERSPFLLASLPGDVNSPTEPACLSMFYTTEAGRVLAFVRCVSAQHLKILLS